MNLVDTLLAELHAAVMPNYQDAAGRLYSCQRIAYHLAQASGSVASNETQIAEFFVATANRSSE